MARPGEEEALAEEELRGKEVTLSLEEASGRVKPGREEVALGEEEPSVQTIGWRRGIGRAR